MSPHAGFDGPITTLAVLTFSLCGYGCKSVKELCLVTGLQKVQKPLNRYKILKRYTYKGHSPCLCTF